MADIKSKYGAAAQAITCTLASLANAALRMSTVVDNTTDLFLDALVEIKIKTGASGVSSTGYVAVYAYGTSDGGTDYTGGASGADGSYTGLKDNLILLGTIAATANATTYIRHFSLASAFGGILPAKWGIVVENLTGAALDGAEGSHSKVYQGILGQTV